MRADPTLTALRREWAFAMISGLAVLVVAAGYRPSSLVLSVPVWGFCCSQLYRALPRNRRRRESPLLQTLGPPTHLTMLRGLVIALASGFLFDPWIAAPAYTAAVLLDGADGALARSRGRETELGSRLDMEIDALGILVAVLAGMAAEKLPSWYVAIGLARYAFVLAIGWSRSRGALVRELDPSRLRRLLAGMQMGFLAAALWPPVPAALSRAASYAFGGATLLMFARDWVFVSSRKASILVIDSSQRG